MYVPRSTWTWAFLLIAIFQCLISVALEGYVFGKVEPSGTRTIPTYLALFIFGFVYELVLVYDALRLKNTIQVIGICLYNLGMLIYASVEMDQVADVATLNEHEWGLLRPFLIAAPCVIALGTILLSFVAWKLYAEFAWTIYKHISADLQLKRRYLTYQIYIALLKFDFFFFLGFTVQFLVAVPNTPNFEFYITIVAIPVTIILLFLAAYFTRRESYVGQSAIIVVYLAGMAYFIYKLFRMYRSSADREQDYAGVKKSLTVFAVLTVILLVVTTVTAGVCMWNFDKGLKPHVQKRKVPDVDDPKYTGYSGSANSPYGLASDGEAGHAMRPVGRMEID